MGASISSTQRKGAAFGLAAAALFGLSAPVAKRLLSDLPPQMLAGLLYLGAGLALSAYRWVRPAKTEAPLVKKDIPTLVLLVISGGVVGPLLMLLGLSRTSAVTGSLLLNLETPFTVILAVAAFGEYLGRHLALAAALIVAGAVLLTFNPGAWGSDPLGVLLLAAACAAWGLDNNLTQRLSLKNPFAIVQVKTLVAGTFNLVLALLLAREHGSAWRPVLWALVLGSVSYGASVVLDAYALRFVGAAREAAYFATAPFLGALAATVVLGESLRPYDWVAMALMAVGVTLLLRERHGHTHPHDAEEHSHEHVHDDHHQHPHLPSDPPGSPHVHKHRHAPLVHDHPHVSDLHHRHRH